MNEEQFSGIVRQYERLIYTVCYQFTRDHHIAEDLAQETFLSAYAHLDACPPDSMKPWLCRIAANKAKDHLKSAYNRRVQAMSEDLMPEGGAVMFRKGELPEDITIAKDEAGRIEADIRALKELYHNVAVLHFLNGVPVEEIARRLGRPPKTVHTQLYRAKQMLRTRLKQTEGGGSDGAVS